MLCETNNSVQKDALARDDNALVLRSIAGDNAAFETLVHRYRRMVIGLIRRVTVATDDVEDLAQQAFMKAFINISKFQFRCSFSSWLVTIAINEARMWGRKHRRLREVPMTATDSDGNPTTTFDPADYRQNPENDYAGQERRCLLRKELNGLASVTRAAIQICDLEQLSTLETAVCLGISVSALKSRRSRGRAELRRRLKVRLAGSRG
jgi:RNA polymerase sigma-70 factor (ECF subfamily)